MISAHASRHVLRVGAAEERVEEPAVVQPVDPARGGDVLRRIAGGVRVVEVERDPDLRAG